MSNRPPQTVGQILGEPVSTTTCKHERAFAARRTLANGRTGPWLHCPECGHARALKVSDYPNPEELPAFDERLRDRLYDQNAQLWVEKVAREREERSREWWDRYNAYLNSQEWQSRRQRVLKRANHICEACLERPAVQVHHTTYKHVCNEPLFELRAVCLQCHEQITEMDRAR